MMELRTYDVKTYHEAMSELEEFGEFVLCNNGIQGSDAVDLAEHLHAAGLDVKFDQNDTILVNGFEKIGPMSVLSVMVSIAKYRPNEIGVYDCGTLRIWWD
jgi:UDP-N-acetylglucosamine enolpyruvyl transferase